MTATTNGASLEDCLTNIFSLIDLNGIRWKRFKLKENISHLYTPIDTHPILTTYAKCIEENHIAVWRQEPQKRHSPTSGQGGGQGGNNTGSANHSNFPTPTRNSNNNTPTNSGPANTTTNQQNSSNNSNNQSNNYELWIFGYGHQLKCDTVIGEDLIEFEDDTWESKGLSYECRTLLFKALHNLIERCLISKGFTKLGRWFVQPLSETLLRHHQLQQQQHHHNLHHHLHHHHHHSGQQIYQNDLHNQHYLNQAHDNTMTTAFGRSSAKQPKLDNSSIITSGTRTNLSTSISATINKIIESKREASYDSQCLDESNGLRHTSIRSSSSYFTTSLDGSKSSLSFAFTFFIHGDGTVCCSVDVRQHPIVHPLTRTDIIAFQNGGIVRVALAPYGLNGILNGVSYKDSDNGPTTTSFVQQWSNFYPLPKTLARLVPGNRSTNSAINNTSSSQRTSTDNPNQYNQSNNDGSRTYLTNLANMLPPPSQKQTLSFNYEPNEVPPLVEVIVAGYRMRYPSECVFTTSKVLDLYKSLGHPTNIRSSATTSHKSRLNKIGLAKPSKLSLLSEKLSEEKHDFQNKSKSDEEQARTQPYFNNPFGTWPTDSNSKQTNLDSSNKKSLANPDARDKNTDHASELDRVSNTTNLSNSNQSTLSRFGSSAKIGLSSYTPLGPTDLVKLFPTPPSLEQITPSPSTFNDESTAKDLSILSPAGTQNSGESLKDNGIDVYKPAEYAPMPPPPKWAALTNITLPSSRSLPPECVYKGSSHKNITKDDLNAISETIKETSAKTSLSTKQLGSSISKLSNIQSAPSPLADQTNKNGYNNLTLNTSPQKTAVTTVTTTTTSSITTTNTATNNTTFSTSSQGTANSSVVDSTPVSTFTLPHQRLFNNLYEVNSIQLNLLISDSSLCMFKDHNFESCPLCVCNMSVKGSQSDMIPRKTDTTGNLWRQSTGNENQISNLSSPGDYVNECTCGFSAISNRHSSHLSGLFFEDELELTNVLYDPTEMIDQNKLFRKLRLSTYSENAYTEENRMIAKMVNEANTKTTKFSDDSSNSSSMKLDKQLKEDKLSPSNQSVLEETRIFVIDQLKQLCASMIHSHSSLIKVLLIESFRNNRLLTSCSNYYAQTSNRNQSAGQLYRLVDETNKYTTVRMLNRNPISLKFSDFCEIAKGVINKLGSQSQLTTRIGSSLVKPLASVTGPGPSGVSSVFARIFSPNRQSSIVSKQGAESGSKSNIFIQGLQALVVPTLAVDPKGALQLLEHLLKDESKEALATLNKAILIFSSPIHDWQFITTPVPENNFDVVNLLKIIQPNLDEAVGSQDKLYKDFLHKQQQHIFSGRDSPQGAPLLPTPPCQGPLTWRQFHSAAGRGTDEQCEPQPIPSLLVGHHVEKNHLAVSPFALKFWDKLLLEPYAPGHNLFYMTIAPDNPNLQIHIKSFFKELSNTYELMKLGKHSPIGNGLILAGATADDRGSTSERDDWFSKLVMGEADLSCGMASQLKAFSTKLNSTLAKTITDFVDERQPPYDSLTDKFDTSRNSTTTVKSMAACATVRILPKPVVNRPFNNILVPNTSTGLQPPDNFGQSELNPMSSSDGTVKPNKPQSLISSAFHGTADDNFYHDDEINKQTGIVIYIIDPFSSTTINQNLRALATIGLMKCYSLLLESLPENIRRITQLQLISLDSIVNHSRPSLHIARADQIKSLSMNIYTRCRRILTNHITAKSLTGFGPASALDTFFKTKNNELAISRMFTPPFILAPMKDKQTELGEMFGDRREKSSVLFCSYCITEDQRWLLASVTNDKGELSETTVINISIVDRMKKPKSSVKRIALRKLMEFIISVMSDWTNPWRLIIGKLGRVGHGELKEWATLLSKRSLLNYSRHLTERCRQCTILPPTETVSILSACLVSLEPDSKLRIMPDQFTSDDRQASFNKCPLSTPEDASATHILVFPTSASIQCTHGNVEDPLAGSGLDDDLLNQFPLEDGIEDLGVEENMDDLFSAWDEPGQANVTDHLNSHHDTIMSSNNLQMGSGSVADNTNQQDETLQLLQQPLALGYYISTAKIGQMPNWFWSTSPHLRNSCPVFLKSALHIHMPCVQLTDDLFHSGAGQSRKTHQLDSNLTTDVLRYVLEGYNSLSWLALNPRTYDRQSCLPVHMQNLLQLYHLMESFS